MLIYFSVDKLYQRECVKTIVEGKRSTNVNIHTMRSLLTFRKSRTFMATQLGKLRVVSMYSYIARAMHGFIQQLTQQQLAKTSVAAGVSSNNTCECL